ncbi:MAG: cupin domain-containing protein [Corynebacterium sp.]|uniref:cupin domain-containing protein n=1 Tax=Corynebacterium sp. TaxID=1720 RepID=UPI002647B233|nr:cupin domain-containing protein [Corynebacterium sp.]MDN5723604.1 cupin domain-containing protein [Corynebacterium sp.]MDN5755485.1 cupin domain-containing protein [Micrococcaceae bacterium]
MQLCKQAEGLVRTPPVPNAPIITVFFGGEQDGPDVGLVRVQVPPGAGMPAHRHNGSDVILAPVVGWVRISKGDESLEVHPGDAALVGKDEQVSLTNPGTETAHVIVAAGPADFVAGIRQWPQPDAQ